MYMYVNVCICAGKHICVPTSCKPLKKEGSDCRPRVWRMGMQRPRVGGANLGFQLQVPRAWYQEALQWHLMAP